MYEEKVNRDVQRERVKKEDYPTLIFFFFFERVGGVRHSPHWWTHPEEPVLLQTPSRGLLSAKLSVFSGPEEKRVAGWEIGWSGRSSEGHSLNEHERSPLVPHSGGSPLTLQETYWLHYNCCPVIQLVSQNISVGDLFFTWASSFFFFVRVCVGVLLSRVYFTIERGLIKNVGCIWITVFRRSLKLCHVEGKIREKKECWNVWQNLSREEKSCKCSNILLYISVFV